MEHGMTDSKASVVQALRASDTWLRTIVEKLDIDPADTESVVDAVSPTERRFLTRTTLADRLSGNPISPAGEIPRLKPRSKALLPDRPLQA